MKKEFVTKDRRVREVFSTGLIFQILPFNLSTTLFAAGNEITSHSALIHDYYARETKVKHISNKYFLWLPVNFSFF